MIIEGKKMPNHIKKRDARELPFRFRDGLRQLGSINYSVTWGKGKATHNWGPRGWGILANLIIRQRLPTQSIAKTLKQNPMENAALLYTGSC